MDYPLTVIFRTDASLEIGTGHVMRCITLASALSERGASISFLCRAHNGNLIDLIRSHGFSVHVLPLFSQSDFSEGDPLDPSHAAWLGCNWQVDVEHCRAVLNDPVDWIIVDHYAIDYRWENAMRDKCHKMMCIDDLADRMHECDLLLDQSFGRIPFDYLNLVPAYTRMLLGPQYALLRREFLQWRKISLARRHSPVLRHILVTMGGIDRDNVTERVLIALQRCRVPTLEKITVILGANSLWRHEVNTATRSMEVPTTVLSGVDNMAELMTSCDMAIGAGGSTTWERCSLGVPTITVILAENQKDMAFKLQNSGATIVLSVNNYFEDNLSGETFNMSPKKLENMSIISRGLTEAKGVGLICEAFGT